MHVEQVAIIVRDYDAAIRFFVDALAFELVEDSPSLTNDGRAKRWVVVRPPGAVTALLLAQADGEQQARAVGDQFAGRVGLFLRVDDFDTSYDRMRRAGVEFVSEPRDEAYGRVAVFLDMSGNRWDLLGPRPRSAGVGAMETIEYRGRAVAVREVARPAEWSCRVLVADDGDAYLEYLVSVGPYKMDLAVVHRLTRRDFAAFEAGNLDLGVLARNLAEHDHAMGTFERRD